MASTVLASQLAQSFSALRQKIDASQSGWPDMKGNQFREQTQAGLEAQYNQFIKELENLEEFIKQARSKVP